MRVAMISEQAGPLAPLGDEPAGAQQVQLAELSVALADLGHEVRIYARRDAPHLPAILPVRDGVRVIYVPVGPEQALSTEELLPYLGDFGQWVSRDWQAGDWQPDVAHGHFWTAGLAAVTAGRRAGVPVVQSFHGLATSAPSGRPGDPVGARPRIGYERVLGRTVDRVIAQGENEMRELMRMGVPRAQLALVPTGVDTERFSPDGPVTARDPQRPRILAVGKLVEHKGFGDVVQAMRYVPEAECVVVGGPPVAHLPAHPFARRLRALAEQLHVADRVRLVGAVPPHEMPRWYRSADLLAATPWYPPAGRSPLEAMASGVPVVGTAVGGLEEAVVDGLTGDLVPIRDPRALGRSMRRLVNDKVRRFSYATAALDRARQCYSWRRAATQIGAVYAAVAGLRRPSESSEAVA